MATIHRRKLNKLHKLITLLLIIAILSPSMVLSASALEISNFVVEDGVLTKYYGNIYDVVIPDDLGITIIGHKAFEGQGIRSVVIPDGVYLIGSAAFSYCTNLTSVTIPDSVRIINYEAFSGCNNLETISIPDSVTAIGNAAFHFCTNLKSIEIPDSVTSIGKSAFVYTALTSIDLPKHITTINEGTFIGCSKLTSCTIPDGVTSIGDQAFASCTSLKNVDIPDSVTTIGFDVFGNTAIESPILLHDGSLLCYVPNYYESYTIPETVTDISGGAFYEGTIKSITIPEAVTEIKEFTFYKCTLLSAVSIPVTVESIGKYAFYGCVSLSDISIPPSVTSIGERALSLTGFKTPILTENNSMLCFVPADIENYTIPDTVKNISGGAFEGCGKITSITIPDGVTTIGKFAFSGCSNLTTVTIPESVNEIGAFAFRNCMSLKWVNIPKSLTMIDDGLFSGCSSLNGVILPSGITSIGECAFYNCKSLASISIPNNTTYIGSIAFSSTNLSSIYLSNSTIEMNGMVFPAEITIYGHSSSTAETYAEASNCSFVSIDRIALPTSSPVTINGQAVAFQAYNIDGNNYFKLRDLAKAISGTSKEYDIGWDGSRNTITITSNTAYTSVGGELSVDVNASQTDAFLTSSKIYLDGEKISITAYNIDGYNYFKLRDLGQALDFGVIWDEGTRTIKINTSMGYSG